MAYFERRSTLELNGDSADTASLFTSAICLPKTYLDASHNHHRYPVLYILDAAILFDLTVGMVDYLCANPQFPEIIIVAISSNNRGRDFTPTHQPFESDVIPKHYFDQSGGADKLLHYLSGQLIPFVEKNYRVQSIRHLLGYSLSGLFVLNTLTNNPQLFDSYLAIDPSLWWDKQYLLRSARNNQEALVMQCKQKYIYFCAANTPEYASFNIKANADDLYQLLSKVVESDYLKYQYFSDINHGDVVVTGLYSGLQHILLNQQS